MKIRTRMKLSDNTLSLLKNFSSINQSILFKKGNTLRTISVMKNILAEATVTEDFAKDFGVYDLNQFLKVWVFTPVPNLTSVMMVMLLSVKVSLDQSISLPTLVSS